MMMVVMSMVMSIGESSLVTDYSFGLSLSSISEKKVFFPQSFESVIFDGPLPHT